MFVLSNEQGNNTNFGIDFDKLPFDIFFETLM